jgi:pimeloyl-ACP methyl ester carboxylesterase
LKLLLLPGTLCDAAVWAPVVAGMSERVECVVGTVNGRDDICQIALDNLKQRSGPLAVAGFSFGGFVALQMARLAPDRVVGLALIGTSARPLPEDQRPERRRRLAMAEAQGAEAYVDALMSVYLHPDHLADTGLVETIRAMARREGLEALRRQIVAAMNRPDSRPDLGRLAMPVMALCGAQDTICPPEGHREIAAAVPRATLTMIERAGHFVTLEQPDATVAAMRDWWARVAPD